MVADAMARSLSSERDIDVRLATTSPVELDAFVASGLDVVLVDFQLRTTSGGLGVLRHPLVQAGLVRVLVMSSSTRQDDVLAARANGASGFIPKSVSMAEIADAIHTMDLGNSYFDSAVGDAQARPKPSERELELLRALRSGGTNAQIGQDLGITSRTVESHLRRLYVRYGTSSRGEMLMLALRQGWVELQSV
jgi:DNA-binding NarL/FixJ family response regulator